MLQTHAPVGVAPVYHGDPLMWSSITPPQTGFNTNWDDLALELSGSPVEEPRR